MRSDKGGAWVDCPDCWLTFCFDKHQVSLFFLGKIEFQLYSIQTHKHINNGAQYILPAEHLFNRDSLTKNLDEKMSIYR